MRFRFFNKLFFTTSGVFIVTLTLVFVLLSITVSDSMAKDRYEVLSQSCIAIEKELLSEEKGISYSTEAVARTLSEVNDIDLFIADEFGKVILCGCDEFSVDHNCIHTNTIIKKDFFIQTAMNTSSELSSVGGMYDKQSYTSTKSIRLDNGDSLYVIAVSSVVNATDLLSLMFGMYAVSALIPLVFMFVAEYSLVYRLIRPLKYMSVAAKSIAKGDFTKRVPVMSNDEIGELSVLFNQMTASLARTEKTSNSFVSNVSHELKTPMTTISGFIDGIVDGTIEESKREYYLKIVSEEVKRLSRLVQSMLNLARLESGENILKLTDFRLSDTIVSIVLSMEQKISEKSLNIVNLDALSETTISADKDLIHQVIYNLVDNAVKFTPENGEIDFVLLRMENSVVFKIRNSGTGIPEKDLPHVFERFYKIDKSRSTHKESLGLGLYICKTIIDLHGGNITVDCSSDDYTEFSVVIPILNEGRESNAGRN